VTTITNSATTSYVATGLSSDTTYYFKVRTYDAGSLYADSSQLNAKTLAPPLPILPIALVIVAVVAVGAFFMLRTRMRSFTKVS
jgi:hypothetical protein